MREVVTVTPCADGPLLLRGPFELVTQDGEHIDAGRATVALCPMPSCTEPRACLA
ncbi:hypothetical protein ACWEPL_22200 [Nonomuraea sp. NPDC004186]